LECLDGLGLGPISEQAQQEIQRARHAPIDLVSACGPLVSASPQAMATIMATLAELAACDGDVSAAEVRVIERVAECLGFDRAQLPHLLESAVLTPGVRIEHSIQTPPPAPAAARRPAAPAAPGQPPAPVADTSDALRALGLVAGASRAQVDAAYLALVERFDPSRVVDLGPEFVVLAVRKLSRLTAAYEAAVAALRA